MPIISIFVTGNSAKELNLRIMEVNFDDLKRLAEALSSKLHLSLLISEIQYQRVNDDGKNGSKGFDTQTIEDSENMYDVLYLYIKILKEIYSNRPLPF